MLLIERRDDVRIRTARVPLRCPDFAAGIVPSIQPAYSRRKWNLIFAVFWNDSVLEVEQLVPRPTGFAYALLVPIDERENKKVSFVFAPSKPLHPVVSWRLR
jgi:hypothetical protein